MGYYNPIYVYGVERFLADADAGVDGLIIVDLPPDPLNFHRTKQGSTHAHYLKLMPFLNFGSYICN